MALDMPVPLDVTVLNSAVETLAEQYHVKERSRTLATVEAFFAMFGMNRYLDFQYDMNMKSMIQEGLSQGWTRPVSEIVTKILLMNDARYQECLIYDLPELLCQDKIKFETFLTKDQAEEAEEEKGDEVRQEACNIESPLRGPELPFLGPAAVFYFDQQNFDNVYDMREELAAKIAREHERKRRLPNVKAKIKQL